jgi:hypothetical protein
MSAWRWTDFAASSRAQRWPTNVQCNAAGQFVLKLEPPWRDGNTRLSMSPLEFFQLPVEWPLCGGPIRGFYFSSGSAAPPTS